MKKNIVFLLILIPIIWISCDGMGHQTIDFRKIENLMPQHPDSALMLLEQIENKENLSRKDKAHYYLLLTEAQDKTFVKHETDSLITIATDYYEETDDLERKAKAWFYKGRINQNLNHPLKAQECFLNALQNEEQIEDHALLGRINNGIGMLYTQQDVYERALLYQQKAVIHFKAISDSTGQVYALRDLGRIYEIIHQKDSAIACYSKTLDLMVSRKVLSVYSELSSLYVQTKTYPEAERLLREIMANKQALGNDIYPFYLTLGEYYYQCGQLDSAKIYLEQCLEKAVRLDTRAGAVYHLSKIALSTKQWILYAELSQRYEMMRDTLDQIEVTNTIRGRQVLYDEQDKQKALAEERVKTANANLRMVVTAIGLALTIPSLLLLGFGHNFPMIIGGGLCFGIGYGIFDANNMPILCQFISPRYRATAYGIMNMTGVFAGAAITDILGKSTDAGNLGHDFAMLAGLVLIALLIQVIFLRPKVANMTDEC